MAPPNPVVPFSSVLATTLSLIDQFSLSLTQSPCQTGSQAPSSPDPLPLLKASATSLKQTTTRLCLLTITPPLTLSAFAPLLDSLNTSVLPSLTTATHLITPSTFTTSFSAEAITLTRRTLSDLKSLVQLIQNLSSTAPKPAPQKSKDAITSSTGLVWSACDAVVTFADGGLAGFMTQRVGQWLELMKDAVKELETWDPEEENSFFGGDLHSEDEDETVQEGDGGEKNQDGTTISAGVKEQALKVLTRIPQAVHVVLKQRLAPAHLPSHTSLSTSQKATLDRLVIRTREVSESIDEAAEAMYLGDLERCLKMAGAARAGAIEVVEAVVAPWTVPSKEDIYIQRALEWIRKVEPGDAKGSAQTSVEQASNGLNRMKIV